MRLGFLMLAALLAAVTGCGIKRPLIPPRDIPAYEKKRQEKLQQQEKEMREFEQQQQPRPPEAARGVPTVS